MSDQTDKWKAEREAKETWLSNLKVGDMVIQYGGGGMQSRDTIGSVDRLTKTLIVTKDGTKYRKDGRTQGSSMYHGHIEEPTEEKANEIRRVNLAKNLNHYGSWSKLSLETLRAIQAAINSESS